MSKAYKAIYKPNQLIYGLGTTAIVTGWTVKEAVAKHLEADEYAVIGQLYSSTRGINILIRNLLANPSVEHLIILNATREDNNSGSCKCLLDFFSHGFEEGLSDTGRKCWVINSNFAGYIDIEVSENSLNQLRDLLDVEVASSIKEVSEIAEKLSKIPKDKQTRSPLIFPFPESVKTILPSRKHGHTIEGDNIAEAWIKTVYLIREFGIINKNAYDGEWQEIIDLMIIVNKEPEDFYFPEPNFLPINREFIGEYISQIMEAPEKSVEGVKYTYGQRLRSWFSSDQVEAVVQKLIVDLHSTRAVMSLWDPIADNQSNSSPPCLNHIWARVSGQALSLTATFRSNDMFAAWPANAMGLRYLQQHIINRINSETSQAISAGPLITISQSAHIYDDSWDNSDRIIKEYYSKILQKRQYSDPVGNFLISTDDNEIFVEHTTSGSGEVIGFYKGRSAKQLYRKISETFPSMDIEHALYLGSELQKAEISMELKGCCYEQDKPLKF